MILWLAVVAAAGFIGCSPDPSTDSETHWQAQGLQSCQQDSDCPAPLSCECGVCTSDCSTGADICTRRGAQNICIDLETRLGDICTSSGTVCLHECRSDSDCQSLDSNLECTNALCLPSRSSAGADAGHLDAADAGDTLAVACEDLEQAFNSFVANNRECQTDADCALVSDWQDCGCNPSLTSSGVGVNKSAASEARAYIRKYHSPECASFRGTGTCDAAPSTGVICDGGTCWADSPSCLGAGDAGGD